MSSRVKNILSPAELEYYKSVEITTGAKLSLKFLENRTNQEYYDENRFMISFLESLKTDYEPNYSLEIITICKLLQNALLNEAIILSVHITKNYSKENLLCSVFNYLEGNSKELSISLCGNTIKTLRVIITKNNEYVLWNDNYQKTIKKIIIDPLSTYSLIKIQRNIFEDKYETLGYDKLGI